MRKLAVLSCLMVLFIMPVNLRSKDVAEASLSYGKVKDGWYEATVKYTNYKTNTFAIYTLDVYVEFDRVTKIDFGNGGSVHSSYNSESYTYTG